MSSAYRKPEAPEEEYSFDFLPDVTREGEEPHDAAAVAAELKALRARSSIADGEMFAELVVEAAKSPESSLHRYFDWEIREAARKWWTHQARQLIRSVKVRILSMPTPEPVRAFVHVQASARQPGHYDHIVRVMSDPERRDLFLSQALSELESFQRRYAQFEELAEIFEAAQKVRGALVR